MKITWYITTYTSPIIIAYIYKRSYPLAPSDFFTYTYFIKLAGMVTLGFFSCFIIRGLSRFRNSDYRKFITAYNQLKVSPNDIEAFPKYLDTDYS